MSEATAKRRLAFRIVETLRDQWPNVTMEGWDDDEALNIVDALLPDSYEELERELDELAKAINSEGPMAKRQSVFGELRKAVYATEDMSVTTVIRAAINKLNERHHDVLRSARHIAVSELDYETAARLRDLESMMKGPSTSR